MRLLPRFIIHPCGCTGLLSLNSLRFSASASSLSPPLFSARIRPSTPAFMEKRTASGNLSGAINDFSSLDISARSGSSRGGGWGGTRSRGRDRAGVDKINALGRLLVRILRHMASELKLNIRSDGFVRLRDLLELNMETSARVSLRSHTIDDVLEAVKADGKQRFTIREENGDLFIRANQGHSITVVETERLLRPILSADEIPVCVHGTYKRHLDSIMKSGLKRMNRLHVHFSCGLPMCGQVISGMRSSVEVLIHLDTTMAMKEGLKLYMSDNKVILTEGLEGVVPVKMFQRVETWPQRIVIPL